jgi:hypothetical protein
MQKVSIRTLALLLELLLAVASHQYLTMVKPSTGAIWLAGNRTAIAYHPFDRTDCAIHR